MPSDNKGFRYFGKSNQFQLLDLPAAGVRDAFKLVAKIKDAKLVSSAYQSRAMFVVQ